MTYLYDADAAIDYLTDVPGSRATFQRLLADGIACSVLTQIELYTGVYASRDPKAAERQLKALLAAVARLGVSQKVVREAARLRYDLSTRRLSYRGRAYDLIVAATALAHDLTVVTSNTDDSRLFRQLTTLDPRTGSRQTH